MVALSFPSEDRNRWIAGLVLFVVALLLVYRAFFAPVGRPAQRAATRGTTELLAPDTRPQPRARGSAAGRPRWTAPAPPSGAQDPTLRLDLLAKVQSISYQGTERNIFQYHTPAPPPAPKPVANPVTTPATAVKPAAPPSPPIPLKYYGYAHKPSETSRRAFFVDGEEIFIASEGEIVNKRYKILKIGVNTVEVEDLVTKHKQTLPLQET